MANLKLYSYWISSCSFRVRIALNLKGLDYEYIPVNLLKGEHLTPEFLELNPISYVPVLVDGDAVVSDSFAILLYLEEKYPQRPLLPHDLHKKAINYQVANIVCSSIQPLQNLASFKVVVGEVSRDEKVAWVQTHFTKGFAALEKLLEGHAGRFATGDEIFMADVFLQPQLNAAVTRFNIDLTMFPLLMRLHQAYNQLPAFQNALPEKQPDAASLDKFLFQFKTLQEPTKREEK